MKSIKKTKGSALVVSIMILSMMIIIALSISLSSLREGKNSAGEAGSSKAFQIADTGVEAVLADINNQTKTTVNQLTGCQSNGLITGTDYEVELFDTNGNSISCTGGALIASIALVKSTGNALGQSRAIEANPKCYGVSVNTVDLVSHWDFDDSASGSLITAVDDVSHNDVMDCYTGGANALPYMNNHPSLNSSPVFMSQGGRNFIRFNDLGKTNCAYVKDINAYHLNVGSISFWVRFRSMPAGVMQRVFSKDADGCDTSSDPNGTDSSVPVGTPGWHNATCDLLSANPICDCGHVSFGVNGSVSNNFWVRFQDDGSGYWYALANDKTKTDFSDAAWHFVTLTFDTDQEILYIDGKIHKIFKKTGSLDDVNHIADFDSNMKGLLNNKWRLWLGSSYDNDAYSKADMDDLRVYKKALTNCEVEALFIGT